MRTFKKELMFIILFLNFFMSCSFAIKDNYASFIEGQKSDFAAMVGQSLIWYDYWEGYWNNTIKDKLNSNRKIIINITRCSNDKNCFNVYVDDLLVYLWFDKFSVWQPGFINYINLPKDSNKDNAIRDYNDYKNKEKILYPKYEIAVAGDISNVLNFGSFDKHKIEIINKLIGADIRDNATLNFLKEKSKNGRSILIHVGNFNIHFPWLYYYIDTTDYIGEIFFDVKNFNILHSDMFYIKENVKESLYENIKRRIIENGKVFELSLNNRKLSAK
jgi:hypothetical protein